MEKRGITLVELLVVISVIGILVAAVDISFEDWMKRYEAEKIMRELYHDLMYARMMAVERNVKYLTALGDYQYIVAEDRDGDGDIDNGEVLPAFPKNVEYKLWWNNRDKNIVCDTRGLVRPNRTISVITGTDAEYDCLKISSTRIITGKYEGHGCVAR
jgi:prepilin-type N-terminal cleavage/methylation domain-containing protein